MLTLKIASVKASVVVGLTTILVSVAAIVVPTILALQSERNIASTGSVYYLPRVSITVDKNKLLGFNNLSMGFFLDFSPEWKTFRDRPEQRQLAKDANFRIVFLADRHLGSLDYSKGVGPCKYWNETTKTGTFSWTDVDSVVRAIFDIGAEPSIVLSRWDGKMPTVPPGMAVDPLTKLPYPDSYGAFAAAWVQHFSRIGLPVRYYEIFGEIQTYVGWNWETRNETRVPYFVDLFNAAYVSMHEANPEVRVSFDASTLKWVFPRLLTGAVGIDSFNFHKYDDWKATPSAFSDTEMFQRAENVYFQVEGSDTYTVDYVRETWERQRGARLPVILSEGNFNAANSPTDERVQQMAGAVRTALVLRMGILKGLSYCSYYTLTSDAAWETATYGAGRGYGMIDCDSYHVATHSYNNPWYPYYVHRMIGSNLALNDPLLETVSSSSAVRALAWQNGSILNLLLISTTTNAQIVRLGGILGSLSYMKIDNTIPYTSPRIQQGTVTAEDPLTLNGYTVILLQSDVD